jgi:ketosteroid isomerase-like protein
VTALLVLALLALPSRWIAASLNPVYAIYRQAHSEKGDPPVNTQTDVLELLDRWAKAELDGDVDAYDELLAPDFVGVGPVGFVLDRQQWAQRHRRDLKNHEFEILDPQVRVYEDTSVVVAVQRQRTSAMGRDTSGSFRLVAVAVKDADQWTLAHIQLSGPLIDPGQAPPFAQ